MRAIRATGADFAEVLADLLPEGEAWPREPESVLMQLVRGLAQVEELIDGRAADLLERESDPRNAIEMLTDWERTAGLPDPCVAEPITVPERQRALVDRLTARGAQSLAYFHSIATRLGYTISIVEHAPFMAGVSEAGWYDPNLGDNRSRWEIGEETIRFYWTVYVGKTRVTWFQAGAGTAGIDPLARIALFLDIECLFRRYKPAHTEVVFSYSELDLGA